LVNSPTVSNLEQPTRTETKQPQNSEPITKAHWIPAIISNAIPLIGVLFFSWNIGHIVILYWIENIILGFWNVPRIFFAGAYLNKLKNLPLSIFFCIHYGIFCLVHGVFIVGLVSFSNTRSVNSIRIDNNILNTINEFATTGLIFGVIIMFLSTGWDLIKNYIISGEHKQWNIGRAMAYPYAHIIVVHIAIFVGAFGAILLGAPLALLLALIGNNSVSSKA